MILIQYAIVKENSILIQYAIVKENSILIQYAIVKYYTLSSPSSYAMNYTELMYKLARILLICWIRYTLPNTSLQTRLC